MQLQQNDPAAGNARSGLAGRGLLLVVLGLCLGIIGDRFLAAPRGISDTAQSTEQPASAP